MSIKNIWDCIRFPFLYPRNRFTGLHYNNWEILDWIKRQKNGSSMYVHLSLTKDETNGGSIYELEGGKILTLEIHGQEIWVILSRAGRHWERVVSKLKAPSKVLEASWGEKGQIYTRVSKLPEEPRFISAQVIYNPIKWAGSLMVDWFHSWPLQLFHCFPGRWTELGALESGWRKAFGENLCKDLRKALWKEGGIKAITNFRITQIKEKWGYLHFYYHGGGEEVRKVIEKYEELSAGTCITCGEKATWISKGWISPYCDLHVPDKDRANPIKEKEEG